MNRKTITLMLLAVTLILTGCQTGPGGPVTATTDKGEFSGEFLGQIDQAVYEIVIKKPFDSPETREAKREAGRTDEIFEDPYEYERPLPWNILDYSVRTDEYLSVGTAFAISENQLVTAAHVLELEKITHWDQYYIRSKDNKVYEIDNIVKYSNHRDFTVFTVKGSPELSYLSPNREFKLNSSVYTVGNAHGEGVVIRDGLLTSTTKESENGEWSYLRFSAAASPGNSGGPLINGSGEVIGVILRKSENENLNYALPIQEVLEAPENQAHFHRFVRYMLAITNKNYGPIKSDEYIDLPLHYSELREILTEMEKASNQELKDLLVEKHRDTLFPYGKGSRPLLHKAMSYFFPKIAAENSEDGVWEIYQPKDIKSAQLEDNGRLSFGSLANFLMVRFRKPHSTPLERFINDSEFYMDTFLKAYPLNRFIGNEEIRITSLGEADRVEHYTDNYNRTWLVRTWDIVFANSQLTLYSLPVPSGFITMALLGGVSALEQEARIDMEEYLNYVFYSYTGTFQEWENFFNLDERYLSPFFDDIAFEYTEGGSVLFRSNEFRMEYNDSLLPVNHNSQLNLKTAYQLREGTPTWETVGISTSGSFVSDNYIALVREYKPESSLTENYMDNWADMIAAAYPYNGAVRIEEGISYANELHRFFGNLTPEEIDERGQLFFVGTGNEGTKTEEEMREHLNRVQEAFSLQL